MPPSVVRLSPDHVESEERRIAFSAQSVEVPALSRQGSEQKLLNEACADIWEKGIRPSAFHYANFCSDPKRSRRAELRPRGQLAGPWKHPACPRLDVTR